MLNISVLKLIFQKKNNQYLIFKGCNYKRYYSKWRNQNSFKKKKGHVADTATILIAT